MNTRIFCGVYPAASPKINYLVTWELPKPGKYIMGTNKTTLEWAFDMARSGRCASLEDLIRRLKAPRSSLTAVRLAKIVQGVEYRLINILMRLDQLLDMPGPACRP